MIFEGLPRPPNVARTSMAFSPCLHRRRFLQALLATAGIGLVPNSGRPEDTAVLKHPIPSSGELLPAIGMGTWVTFDVGSNPEALAERLRVLQAFFDRGGGLIDSSPMYGSAEYALGLLLKRIANRQSLFSATKVWIYGQWLGVRQMEKSLAFWGLPRFDLMQVHNLLDWEGHLETLQTWKADGRIRYIGITTSHGRRHEEMAHIMNTVPLDFAQFTYNIADREAEQRLLPLAMDRGIAVIANRPFQHGGLFSRIRGKPLPPWAADLDCRNWAQFFLKFIVSHPGVTCAIPATSRVDHLAENMGAGVGRQPDAAMRRHMAVYFDNL